MGSLEDANEVTQAFCSLASSPSSAEDHLDVLERFVIFPYDRTSTEEKVNNARKQIFSQKGRPMDGLAPTQAAPLEHTKRAAYQAGHVWAHMFVVVPTLLFPCECGWLKNNKGGLEVNWTALPDASSACRELLRCGYKKGCTRQCKCVKAALQCTTLCLCGGRCDRG